MFVYSLTLIPPPPLLSFGKLKSYYFQEALAHFHFFSWSSLSSIHLPRVDFSLLQEENFPSHNLEGSPHLATIIGNFSLSKAIAKWNHNCTNYHTSIFFCFTDYKGLKCDHWLQSYLFTTIIIMNSHYRKQSLRTTCIILTPG